MMATLDELDPGIEIAPLPEVATRSNRLSVTVVTGTPLTMWTPVETVPNVEGTLAVQLQPEQTVVIGRQEGGEIEYLDPSYQPTRLAPNSHRPIVTSLLGPRDRCVSRGHFMLKGVSRGILLVNGVPRRGGGIRPPMNWTRLLAPECRLLLNAEEYLIERGDSIRIELPNGAVLALQAE